MASDQRLQALEDEHKVIKGEVKQTLENIRDFLLDLNLPALQEDPIIGELHEHEEHHEDVADASAPAPAPAPAPKGDMLPNLPSQPGLVSSDRAAPPPPAEQGVPSISQVTTIGPVPPQPRSFDDTPAPQNLEPRLEPPPASPPPPSPQPAPPEDVAAAEPPPSSPPPSSRGGAPLTGAEDYASPEVGEAEIEEPELSVEDDESFEEEAVWPSAEADEASVEEPAYPEEEIAPFDKEEDWPMPERPSRPVRKREESRDDAGARPSPVNQLTNLIRWVSQARTEIGIEQIPAFLDVYCIGEELSQEVREVIMYLAERIAPVTAGADTRVPPAVETGGDFAAAAEASAEVTSTPEPSDDKAAEVPVGNADVWSRLILELHGILGHGDTSFRPRQLQWSRPAETALPGAMPGDEGAATAIDTPEVSQPENETALQGAEETEAGLNPPQASADGEETLEVEVVKKKKTRGRKKKAAGRPSLSLDNRSARLKLVLPVNGHEEQEFSIGEFSLNIAPVESKK